jgi:hypothetical protein
MAGVGIDDFGALFTKYLPGVIETLNSTSAARMLPLGSIKWEGDHIEKVVHVRRNAGVTMAVDGGALPVAGKQTYATAKAYRKFLVGSVKVTDGLLATAATTANAAISATESELTGLLDNMKTIENFTWTRDGTGLVANVGTDATAASAGDTFTVDDARGLWDGQDYEIRNGATVDTASFQVRSTARTPTSSGEFTVTTEGGVSSTAGYDIYWKTGNLSMYGRAITGLDKLIDNASGTFQNVNVTTYPRYTSPVLSNSSVARPLTPTLFRQMLAMIKQESGADASANLTVLTSVWDMVNMEELYEGELRLTATDRVAGLDIPTFQSNFGKFSVMTDQHAPFGKMFFIDRSQITYARQKELAWRTEGANSIFKRDDNNLSYSATALGIGELFIEDRRRCGKITDLKFNAKTAY